MPVTMRIEKRGSKWVVLPETGDEVLGEHDTREEAEAQLRAIEARKHAMATAEGALHHDELLGEPQGMTRNVLTVPAWRFSVSTGKWDQFAKFGTFEKDGSTVVFDETTLGQIVDNFADRQNDIGMDHEHQALNAPVNGQPAPALAWYSALALVVGGELVRFASHDESVPRPDTAGLEDGLYGFRARVTPLGEELLPNYRYISPAFTTDGANEKGESVGYDLLNIAATNTPFLDGMAPIEMRRFAGCVAMSQYAEGQYVKDAPGKWWKVYHSTVDARGRLYLVVDGAGGHAALREGDIVASSDRRPSGFSVGSSTVVRMARTSGYVYHLESGSDWRGAPDDDWETVARSVDGEVVGRRQIDGASVVVISSGGQFYAALPQNVSMARQRMARSLEELKARYRELNRALADERLPESEANALRRERDQVQEEIRHHPDARPSDMSVTMAKDTANAEIGIGDTVKIVNDPWSGGTKRTGQTGTVTAISGDQVWVRFPDRYPDGSYPEMGFQGPRDLQKMSRVAGRLFSRRPTAMAGGYLSQRDVEDLKHMLAEAEQELRELPAGAGAALRDPIEQEIRELKEALRAKGVAMARDTNGREIQTGDTVVTGDNSARKGTVLEVSGDQVTIRFPYNTIETHPGRRLQVEVESHIDPRDMRVAMARVAARIKPDRGSAQFREGQTVYVEESDIGRNGRVWISEDPDGNRGAYGFGTDVERMSRVGMGRGRSAGVAMARDTDGAPLEVGVRVKTDSGAYGTVVAIDGARVQVKEEGGPLTWLPAAAVKIASSSGMSSMAATPGSLREGDRIEYRDRAGAIHQGRVLSADPSSLWVVRSDDPDKDDTVTWDDVVRKLTRPSTAGARRFAKENGMNPDLFKKLGFAEGAEPSVEDKLARFAQHFASGEATPEDMKAMADSLEEHADSEPAAKMARHFKKFAEGAEPFAGTDTPDEDQAKEQNALARMARALGLPDRARPSQIAVAFSARTAPLTTVADLQAKVARLEQQLAARAAAETAARAQTFARQAVADGRTTSDKAKLVEDAFIQGGNKAAEALLFQKGTFTVLRRFTAGGEIPGKANPPSSDAQPEPDDIRGRVAAKTNEIMESARKAGAPIAYATAMSRVRSVDPELYAAYAALGTPSR